MISLAPAAPFWSPRPLDTSTALVAASGSAPIVVAGGRGDQQSPAVAAGGGGYLAVWETCTDCAGAGADIAAMRLGLDGLPSGVTVTIAASAADERGPSVAWNPDVGEFLAVWNARYPGAEPRYAVFARRLAGDGSPLSEAEVVAEVDGVWPAAVVSSRGAWHGYEVAWARSGPRPDRTATIIAARHVAANGSPQPEIWQVSDAEFEALRPLASRASRASGTLLAWFAYGAGDPAERASMRGIRLGASGRPTGIARELAPPPVCGGAMADDPLGSDLLAVIVSCDGPLFLTRLNRSGDRVGEHVTLVPDGASPEVAATALADGGYLVVFDRQASADAHELAAWRLDAEALPIGQPTALGAGAAPAAASGENGGSVVLASLDEGVPRGRDVVAYRLSSSATQTPTATLPRTSTPTRATPGSATATATDERPRASSTPTATDRAATPTPTITASVPAGTVTGAAATPPASQSIWLPLAFTSRSAAGR